MWIEFNVSVDFFFKYYCGKSQIDTLIKILSMESELHSNSI